MRKLLPTVLLAFCASLLFSMPPVDAAEWMGWYLPLHLGASWSYENADNPFDVYVEAVFELIEYEGHPAFRFGTDLNDHTILYKDGGVITVYADVEGGVLHDLDEDIVLGEVVDGDYFEVCFASPCDTSLIRVWANLDPSLRSIYGIDPALTDMVMFASYDSDYPPNLHNIVVESNLPGGVTPPAGAVTELEWYLRGVGMVHIWDIDAASGGLEDHHVLTVAIGIDDRPPPASNIASMNVAPNPFNPRTTIQFQLASPEIVTVSIYDCAGRKVRTLAAGEPLAAGDHSVDWDGLDARGRALPSGTYLCRIATDIGSAHAKLVLVR